MLPAPCAPRVRSEREICLAIPNPATEAAFVLLLSEIRSRASFGGVQRFSLDCTRISGIPAGALVDLLELRGNLRQSGSDLALIRCPIELQQTLQSGAFASLLGATPAVHGGHALRGPHAAFLRSFRAGA